VNANDHRQWQHSVIYVSDRGINFLAIEGRVMVSKVPKPVPRGTGLGPSGVHGQSPLKLKAF